MQRSLALPLALLAAAIALAVFGVIRLTADDDEDTSRPAQPAPAAGAATLRGPADAPFTLQHPRTWRAERPADDAPSQGLRALAVLRREGDSGVVAVSLRGPVGGLDRLRRTLPRALDRRFKDFRLQASRVIRVRGGEALYTTWIRERTGRVQANVVIPDGSERSYALDATLPGNAQQAARELGGIVASFDPGSA